MKFCNAAWLWVAALLLSGCFPTLQSARIDRGFHLDGGATFIADQQRNGQPQGHDYFAYVTPSYGFRDRFEIGVPIGIYLEEGLESLGSWEGEYGSSPQTVAIWPYIKVGFTEPDARDQIAFTLQSALILPANAGIAWSRDLGKVNPMIGATVIFSSGSAGDDPAVTRYQEAGQLLLALHAGAEIDVALRPTIVAGVLRNRYREGAISGDFGQPTTTRTLYDVYVGMRFRMH